MLYLLVAILAFSAFVTPLPNGDSIANSLNEARCMSEPPESFLAESQALQKRGILGTRRYNTPINQSSLLLDAYFHVVTTTPNEITETQLHQQMEVLNDNFSPYNIQFRLRGIDWTINATWANDTYEYWMKMKLHRGDYKTLNVYFISHLTGNGLGACTFPQNHTLPTFDTIKFMDGCTVDAQTVPGGKRKDANLGKTTTHEVGHWFGLYHTFYGGCQFGDGIDDTPAQGEAGSPETGCNKTRDSCPDQPGNDPMFNYMDYTGDLCYREFTPGQKARMFENFHAYRASF